MDPRPSLFRRLTYYLHCVLLQDVSTDHAFGVDDLVIDHHHGGRIKWARNPFALGGTIALVSANTHCLISASVYL